MNRAMAAACARCPHPLIDHRDGRCLWPSCPCTQPLPTLFDRPLMPTRSAMEEAADEAVARVDRHAASEWKTAAYDIIASYAPGYEFMAEEVTVRLAELGYGTHDNRAMGAVIRRAADHDLIIHTDRFDRARMGHGRPMPIWRRTAKTRLYEMRIA